VAVAAKPSPDRVSAPATTEPMMKVRPLLMGYFM
jgi:hypothetical protein